MNVEQPDLNRLIDLLVDDELDPGARRILFDRLDAEPDGWRRCACAFLEAQSWRAAITPVMGEAAPAQVRRASPARRRPALGLAGAAAGLLGAFILGWAARGGTPPKGDVVAALPPVSKTVSANNPVAPVPSPPKKDGVERATRADIAKTVSTRQTASPLTESVRRRLQQRGFEVEQQRRFLALDLKNGRRLTVPVEEVKVRYVRNQTL